MVGPELGLTISGGRVSDNNDINRGNCKNVVQ